LYEKGEKRETESISLRLDTRILEQLRNESAQKEVSFNTLASQIFRKHIEWDNNAAKAGLIPFPKSLITRILDHLDDEDVRDAARYIAETQIRDIILLLRKQYEFATFIDVIISWFRVSQFPYSHTIKDTTHTFVIQHDMGKKYSQYFAELLQCVFEDLASRPEIDMTSNSVVFKVDPVRCGIGEVYAR
jgi:hypothetical protein